MTTFEDNNNTPADYGISPNLEPTKRVMNGAFGALAKPAQTTTSELGEILKQFNSKCINIYENKHKYTRAELITADLDKELAQTIKAIEQKYIRRDLVIEAMNELCGCENGYFITGGMAMEDDLVEEEPCPDCHQIRQALNLQSKER